MKRGRKTPLDPRSTGRKRARKKLFHIRRPFKCVDCGRSPIELPVDCPKDIEIPGPRVNIKLEANHINKNILDNDPANLEWLCSSCHKRKDQQTGKGESTVDDEFGYGF